MQLLKKTISVITALSLSAAALLSGCGVFAPFSVPTDPAGTTVPASESPTSAATEASEANNAPTPLLWKVTGDAGNVLYLFGTIHLGDERNETILRQLANRLDACDALAVECDVVAFEEDKERLTRVVQSMLYTDGTKASDHMRADLYDKAKEYLTAEDEYNELYNYYNLSFWSSLLQQTAIGKSDLDTDLAMDTLLLRRAKEQQQDILEAESVEFQYDMDNSFPDAWYNLQIEAFFEENDAFIPELNKLYEAWTTGDEATITAMLEGEDEDASEGTEEERKLAEDYHKKMYTDRNNGMTAKAESYLLSGKSVFFAVGEAHMIGDEGIVRQLTDKGYRVEKVSP